MAEVLVEFDAVLPGRDGARYTPRACGRVMDDGRWEGWLEFIDVDTTRPIRSMRETTQPNRADLMYWATGLTRVYLEGALDRALVGPTIVESPIVHTTPAFDGPAPAVVAVEQTVPRAVLDPFDVYTQGEHVLRQELMALDVDHLRAIIRAFALQGGAGAQSSVPGVLVEYIVAEVRARSSNPQFSGAG